MNRQARILVVDDEPNVRLVLRTALEPVGYLVDEAGDGLAALERATELSPDLVLLDLQMPLMDGVTTLGRLRASGRDVPVVQGMALALGLLFVAFNTAVDLLVLAIDPRRRGA